MADNGISNFATRDLREQSSQMTVPGLFNAEELDTNTDFNLPENTSDGFSGFLGSLTPFLNQLSQGFGVPQAEQQEDVLTQRLGEQLDKLGEVSGRRVELETEAGIPENLEQLKELNLQIQQQIGSLGLGEAAIEGKPIPMELAVGQQAQLQKTAAAKIGALTATAQALQGNVALAQDTISRTIEQEFAPVETEIEKIKTFLQLNSDKMSRAEKRRAEALELALGERERQIQDQKEERNQIFQLGIQAAQSGADNQLVSNIFDADSIEEAVGLAQPFLRTDVTPIKLGEGDILIDPVSGNIIAEGNPVPPEELSISDRFNFERGAAKDFESWAKDARSAQNQIEVIKTGGQEAENLLKGIVSEDNPDGSLNAASQAILVAFQKLLDPTSVVRESEYARSGTGLSLLGRIEGQWEKMKSGGAGVSAQDLQQFVGLAEQFYQNYNNDLVDIMLRTKNTADKYGLDLESIFRPSDIQLLDTHFENRILDFIEQNPQEQANIEALINENPNLSNEDLWSVINPDFNQVGGDTNTASVGYLNNFGQVTGEGSPLWKHGLDVDLAIGDKVTAPIDGNIVFAGENGGFGNQVKIEGSDGRTYWLSHLDKINAKVGQRIRAGQLIGLGGNTGSVIPMGGGDGSHLDITVQDKNGNFIPPTQIRQLLA